MIRKLPIAIVGLYLLIVAAALVFGSFGDMPWQHRLYLVAGPALFFCWVIVAEFLPLVVAFEWLRRKKTRIPALIMVLFVIFCVWTYYLGKTLLIYLHYLFQGGLFELPVPG